MKKRYAVDEYFRGIPGFFEKRFDVFDRNKTAIDNSDVVVCTCYTRAAARKIAKALNEMEAK